MYSRSCAFLRRVGRSLVAGLHGSNRGCVTETEHYIYRYALLWLTLTATVADDLGKCETRSCYSTVYLAISLYLMVIPKHSLRPRIWWCGVPLTSDPHAGHRPSRRRGRGAEPVLRAGAKGDSSWRSEALTPDPFIFISSCHPTIIMEVRSTSLIALQDVCSPSRAAILTGRFPLHNTIDDWIPPASSYGVSSYWDANEALNPAMDAIRIWPYPISYLIYIIHIIKYDNNNLIEYPNPQLPLNETTMADRLSAGGYVARAVGKWHLGFYKWYEW